MTSTQFAAGSSSDRVSHYDVHNLYGYSEAVATAAAWQNIKPSERQLVVSRSTFPGMGRVGSHWLGVCGGSCSRHLLLLLV